MDNVRRILGEKFSHKMATIGKVTKKADKTDSKKFVNTLFVLVGKQTDDYMVDGVDYSKFVVDSRLVDLVPIRQVYLELAGKVLMKEMLQFDKPVSKDEILTYSEFNEYQACLANQFKSSPNMSQGNNLHALCADEILGTRALLSFQPETDGDKVVYEGYVNTDEIGKLPASIKKSVADACYKSKYFRVSLEDYLEELLGKVITAYNG